MFLIIKIYNTYLIIIRYELYIPDYGKNIYCQVSLVSGNLCPKFSFYKVIDQTRLESRADGRIG